MPGAAERRLATVFFTDMVGSTELASRLGDRRWRLLLSTYQRSVRRALRQHGGKEVDNAGDGFFAVFDQPARAIACACRLTDTLHVLGIEVRTGVHIGEVERVGAKFGGIAVHIGSRVIGVAKPGEVVVSSTVRDVVTGADYTFEDDGAHTLKGVPGEWHLYRVLWPGALPLDNVALQPWEGPLPAAPARLLRRFGPVAAGLLAAAVALFVALFLLRSHGATTVVPTANTAARIDEASNMFASDVAVGSHPNGIAIGGGAVWVINSSDQTLTRIDIATGQAAPGKALNGAPTSIAFGAGSVWVSVSSSGTVYRFDGASGQLVRQIADAGSGIAGSAFGANALWIANKIDDTVIRIDPVTNGVVTRIPVGRGPQAVAVDGTTVWVANTIDRTLSRVDAVSNAPKGVISVTTEPDALAAGGGSLWVASTAVNTVQRLDSASGSGIKTLMVSTGPVGLVVARDGGVWVCASTAQRVDHIDASYRVVASLTVKGQPQGVASQGDGVWVAVSSD
jgi:YVTN family beta-propeller protein